jgi:hypothetical protein
MEYDDDDFSTFFLVFKLPKNFSKSPVAVSVKLWQQEVKLSRYRHGGAKGERKYLHNLDLGT